MKSQAAGGVGKGKQAVIGLLFTTSIAIAVLGIAFCAYCLLNGVEFSVMQTTMPGAVFGMVIAFLGIRYFLAVRKLRVQVYRPSAQFSWGNFKGK